MNRFEIFFEKRSLQRRQRILVWILALALIQSPTPLSRDSDEPSEFIVWNVGQGLWTTWKDATTCLHFDTGGEKFPFQKIRSLCQNKINRIHLSHWDLDHINGLRLLSRWKSICVFQKSTEGISMNKKLWFQKFEICDENLKNFTVIFPFPKKTGERETSLSKDSNGQSEVIVYGNLLVPGDSTEKQEFVWSEQKELNSIRGLVLGHHGSRSSTSSLLLRRISHLRWAVASSRWKRYRHPHPEVVHRLKEKGIPLLRTEDWGNLHFQLEIPPGKKSLDHRGL